MNLWTAFAESAASHAGRDAIVQGDRRTTYDAWLRRAGDYAAAIERAAVPRHGRVLVWMENSAEMAAALFGIWKAGAIAVLLNPASPAGHVAHALGVAEPALVLRAPDLAWPDVSASAPMLHAGDVPAARATAIRSDVLPTEPASIVFTSGSTGRPKGVTQSHGNLLAGCRTVTSYLGIGAEDRIVCPVPWSFDYGYGQMLSTALAGIPQILPTESNPFGLCEAIARHRPTVLPGLPSWFTYLLRGVSPIATTDLSSLRVVTNTGGSIPSLVLDDMQRVFGHCRIFLNYGLTESYRTSCLDPALVRERPRSIGKGIPGVSVAVLREDGSPAAADEEGEIVHRGAYLCMGYWNDPEATARALRPDPLAPAGCPDPRPVLFTGDYGHLDADGFLYYHGRRDRLLKSMGVRVSPGEVEDLLFGSGLVREVAVFGRPHDLIGDEVWAAIVPGDVEGDALGRLRAYARGAMSQYMQPRRYLVRTAMPRTPSGKVDYPALEREAARAPSASLTGAPAASR